MRRIKQENYFPIITAIHFLFWWLDLALYQGDYEFTAQHIAGEVFSSWVVTVFAANFLMATRARWVENMFGGLDKMYMVHRRSGVIAIVLLLLHFIVIPKYPQFTIGKPLGFYSLILILIGVVVSRVPLFQRKFKYNKWINFHKLMGIFYVLGIAHSFYVPTLTSELPIVRTYVYGMAAIGIIAWLYKAFFYKPLHKKLDYTVTKVTKYDNDTMDILLSADGKALDYKAGQFAFISFDGVNKSEPHPFTVSNHPSNSQLRFTIKALGDYTANIQGGLDIGQKAKIEGPFGKFDYKTGRHQKQIWLAGGIGITPFLPFLEDADNNDEIVLIWSVASAKAGIYDAEINQIIANKPNIKFVLWDSETKGYFSIGRYFNTSSVKDNSVFICGPEIMRENYIKQLLEKGAELDDIHYEEFSFR